MKKTLNFFLFVFVMLIAVNTSKAQVLMTENFDYTAGQLTNVNSGANVSGGNWVSYSGTSNAIQVADGNLSYTNYLLSTGRLVSLVVGSAEDAYRQFTTQSAGNTVYVSFLLNVTSTTGLVANTSTTGDYTVSLMPSTSTSNLYGRVSIRAGSVANTFNVGIRATSSNTVANFISTDYAINTPVLVVLKYEIISGNTNDVASIWVNPTIGSVEPAADVSQISALTSDPSDIGRITLRQGTNSMPGQIDGIRVAKSWADLFNNYTVNWANLQSPANGSIIKGGSFTVYAQAFLNGLSDQAGATPGLQSWIGYNTENTDPSTWTNWVPATFNTQVGNNDEFMADLGSAITNGGTYYYASRWKYSLDTLFYGGFNGGFWDGTTNINGTLFVNAPPAISNLQFTPSTPTSTQTVAVTATITDETAVYSANVFYSTSTPVDTTTATKIAMTDLGSGSYSATIPAQVNGTTIHFVVTSSDVTDLRTVSAEQTYNVTDLVPPSITNVLVNPATPNSLQDVTVSATMTDVDGTITIAKLYWSLSAITDTATVNKLDMSNGGSGDVYSATIPAQVNGSIVYYEIAAKDNDNNITTSTGSYTVTNPTSTITKAFFMEGDSIEVIYTTHVPMAAIGNYSLQIGTGDFTIPSNLSTKVGATVDTVILWGFDKTLPVDNILDSLRDNFYSAGYKFYANLMPISYTNTSSTNVINNNRYVTLKGVVTADDEYNQIWIQDAPGAMNGVMIYSTALKNLVNVGDVITLAGQRSPYNGSTEIISPIVIKVEHISATPVTTIISAADLDSALLIDAPTAEQWEGQLVTVKHQRLGADKDTYYQYYTVDCDGNVIITDDDAWFNYGSTSPLTVNNIYDLTGVITFSKNAGESRGHYKLNIRNISDVVLIPFDLAELQAPTTQTPSDSLAILDHATELTAVEVGRFVINDMSGVDGLPVVIDNMTITAGPLNTADFTVLTAGGYITKSDGTVINFGGQPTVTANSITLPLAFDKMRVENGTHEEYIVYIFFDSNAVTTTLQFQFDAANMLVLDATCYSSPLNSTGTVTGNKFTFYKPLSLNDVNNQVSVYPNPASDVVTLSNNVVKATVFNALGQAQNVQLNNNVINVSKLSAGVYTIRMTLNNGSVVNQKIIKK